MTTVKMPIEYTAMMAEARSDYDANIPAVADAARAMLAALEALIRANDNRRKHPKGNFERACQRAAENTGRAAIAQANAAGITP